MQFVESFTKLGYVLKNNYAWSAENETGVCITIWQDEIERIKSGDTTIPRINLWELHKRWELLGKEPPFKKQDSHKNRIPHLQKAMNCFGGRVDVIILEAKKPIPKSGETGRKVKNDTPWERKGGFWKITKFCPETGYFSAEVVKL